MRTLGILMTLATVAVIGCDDDDAPASVGCVDIISACHPLEGLSEAIDACHDIGHDGDETMCMENGVRCTTMVCVGDPPDGSVHDHDHDHDGSVDEGTGDAGEHVHMEDGSTHDHEDGSTHDHEDGSTHDEDGSVGHDHDAPDSSMHSEHDASAS